MLTISRLRPARFIPCLRALTFAACLLLLSTRAEAQNTPDCIEALAEAERAYFNGDFENSVSLLQPCLTFEGYSLAQRERAYALVGRIQFVLGNEDAAREAIRGLYANDPGYEPDPQFPPNFRTFILDFKQQMIADGTFPSIEPEEIEPAPPVVTDFLPEDQEVETQDDVIEDASNAKAQKTRKFLLFGGGAAIAVAAGTAILLGGNSNGGPGTSEWPLPPAHPQ